MDQKWLEHERQALTRCLAYWEQQFLLAGGAPEAFAAIRFAVELDEQGDSIDAGVPVCAPGYLFSIGPAARGAALARFCLDRLNQCNTPLWREKRRALDAMVLPRAVIEAVAPDVDRAMADRRARREAGRKGGEGRHRDNDTAKKVQEHWKRLEVAKRPERDRASIIASALGLTAAAVRLHVQKLGLRKAQGKVA